jgi:hypothetical protein
MGIGDEIIINTSNNILYKCLFNLLALLNPVIKIDNKYVLPVNFFDIFLIASTFSSFIIEININNLEFKKISFLTQKIFIKQDVRDRFLSYEHIIKSPLSNYKIINSNQVNFIICSHEKIDGYYIESNINNIKSISINMYDEDTQKELDSTHYQILKYNKLMIDLYLKKISDSLLYIPLNINKINALNSNLSNFSFGTFGTENLSCIKQAFIIKIKFYEQEEKIGLHTFAYNKLRYLNGITGPMYITCYTVQSNFEAGYNNFELNGKLYNGNTFMMLKNTDKINFDNFFDNLEELKIVMPKQNITNLPINLKKLEIYNKPGNINIKYPFGCEYIEKSIK